MGQEHRPHGTVSMKKKIDLISTTGRIRMEYRIKDSGSTFRNRNRFYLGVKIKKLSVYKPTLYFMQQRSLKNNKWESFGVLGLKISF